MNENNLGLLSSAALHLLLLTGFAVASQQFAQNPLMPLDAEFVEIDIETIADAPQVIERPKPSVEAAPRETVLDAAPQPKEAPDEAPKTDGLPSPDAVPTPKSQTTSGSRMDTRKLANLIDKSVREADRKPKEFSNLAKKLERDLPQQATLSSFEATTWVNAIQNKMLRCWSKPPGRENWHNYTVRVDLKLKPDGKLSARPQVFERIGASGQNASDFSAFELSVLQALSACEPYVLPSDKYEFWREWRFRFNPQE
jgi:hypothetical protein